MSQLTCKGCGAVLDCEDNMKDVPITCPNCNGIANPPEPAVKVAVPPPAAQESEGSERVIAPPPEEKRLKFKTKKAADAPAYDPAMFPRPQPPKVSVLAITLIVFAVLSGLAFLFNLLFVINNSANICALFAGGQSDEATVQTATMAFLVVMNTVITLCGTISMSLLAAALWKNQKVAHKAETAAVTAEEALFIAKMTMDK